MPWPKDAIIYHILIDRFCNDKDENISGTSNTWMGGNLKGILKKLLYLKELGINTIWISPFYKATSYHGYDIENYYEVDQHFGSKADLKQLVEACHNINIKVIADFVPNHCSFRHPFFPDAQKNQASKYKSWFTFKRWPDSYLTFLDLKNLPKLNLENNETRQYIIDAAKYWVKEFELDGFRLDHAIGPSINFWKEFIAEIRKVKKDFIFLGEVWFFGVEEKHSPTLSIDKSVLNLLANKKSNIEDAAMKQYDGILTGCLDFTFNSLIDDFIVKQKISQMQFNSAMKMHYKSFSKEFLLPTFLDNHDMDRFLYRAKNKTKLKKALKIQFSIPQPAIIYYGSEIGLRQELPIAESSDIEARRFMEWQKDNWDCELFNFYKNNQNQIKPIIFYIFH